VTRVAPAHHYTVAVVTTDIDAMHKRGLRCRPVSVCPSVCHVGA